MKLSHIVVENLTHFLIKLKRLEKILNEKETKLKSGTEELIDSDFMKQTLSINNSVYIIYSQCWKIKGKNTMIKTCKVP